MSATNEIDELLKDNSNYLKLKVWQAIAATCLGVMVE